jgi:hypothetical protein
VGAMNGAAGSIVAVANAASVGNLCRHFETRL